MLLLPTIVFGQSGEGYINYKSYKTHYGNAQSSTDGNITYTGISDNIAELVATLDVNQPGTTLYASGETAATTMSSYMTSLSKWNGERYGFRFEGWIQAQETGTYSFGLQSDDASAFYLDDNLKLFRPCCGTSYVNVSLTSGQWYKLEVLFQEYTGGDYMYFLYSPPSSASYWYVGGNASHLKLTNIEPTEEPIDPGVDFQFEFQSQMTPQQFKFGVYYDATTEQNGGEWLNTSTTNSSYYLDDDGTKDVTDYLNLVKLADGKKATTVGGSVEWCVVYDYDNTNKRYRVGIDKREFPSGFTFTDLKKLQLFDLWDGDITYMSDDAYWANYYIYTDTQFDFTNSTFSSYIRDANGFYGMRAEFSFENLSQYKQHKLMFSSYGNVSEFIDDYVTVADVVAAFNELAGGGINGGFKGDLNGVQLQNADVNLDGNFDFQDTQKILSFLQGETNLLGYQRTSDIMRIIPKSEYDGTTTSNWKTQPHKSVSAYVPFELIYDSIQTPQYKVTFLGDVNFSHSAPHVEVQLGGTARIMSTRYSSTQKDNSLEVNLDIEKTKEHIIVTLDLPENNFNLVGSEFRIGFDNTRLEYDKLETNSTMNTFDAERETYLKIGSISTDGSQNLNGGIQYKIYFKLTQTFDSILGLVSIKKSEVVDSNANTIDVIIK